MPNANEKKVFNQRIEVLKEHKPTLSDIVGTPATTEQISDHQITDMHPVFTRNPPIEIMRKKAQWSFDFVSLLQYQEHIAGLAIQEDSASFMLYTHVSGNDFVVDTYKEETLAAGVISEGNLIQQDTFMDSMRALWKPMRNRGIGSIILSLPPEHTWLTRIEFPPHLKGADLEDAINLFKEFSLPFSKDDVYTDWELITSDEKKDIPNIVFGAARKSIINSYLQAFSQLEISTIAIENHLISVERSLRGLQLKNMMVVIVYPSSISLGAFSNSCFRFQRSLPWKRITASPEASPSLPYAELCEEIKKFLHFLKTEASDPLEITNVFLIAPEDIVKTFESYAGLDIPLWRGDISLLGEEYAGNRMALIAKGAALRGIVPRRDDTIISLTPIGTEQIYERKRAVSFSSFFARLAIGIGLFFVLLYGGSYFLISHLAFNVESRQVFQSTGSANAIHIQEEASKFNREVNKLSDLAKRLPQFDQALKNITQVSNQGISISTIAIHDPTTGVNITGFAKNKDSLLQFKASINSSGMFKPVDLPFASLLAKGNIPFRFSLFFEKKDFLFK